ncbi:CYTH and CHAD domain-containing protein [Mycobacterium sp.]|uniref:CYTH and CHAD domain-containing protein n=1 Tax=Mycobacterium sp. TaxID=1785 RepID=UPI0025EEC8F7|nr:CYTH and CHAD domain-containing protein [Mycobacterium sp.]
MPTFGDGVPTFGDGVFGNAFNMRDKWDIDDQFVLPTLEDLVDNSEAQHDTIDMTNVYYDTADQDLRAHGIELRRRDGDRETGWLLKIPDGHGPAELRWLPSDDPPAEAIALLTGVTLRKPIETLAKIHTVREHHRIGTPQRCVEVDDDRVRASVGERLLAWREIKVESGASSLAKRFAKRLRSGGARPVRYSSRLARACPPAATPKPATPGSRALVAYLNAQIDQVIAGDIALRRGRDPIHDTRVAIRRLRSTLRVFGNQFDDPSVDTLEGELKWFAGLLGAVRDCQVQRRRFTEALQDVPDKLILGPVQSRIRQDLQAVEFPARTQVSEAMESERYLTVMATLCHWRLQPPVDRDIAVSALRNKTRRAGRKADRRLAAALESGDDAVLHRARKAAKRARYAAELCRPFDKRMKRTAKHYKEIQSVLGDHQDTMVAIETLRRMAVAAGTTDGENGFTFGILYAREQQIARQSRAAARNI